MYISLHTHSHRMSLKIGRQDKLFSFCLARIDLATADYARVICDLTLMSMAVASYDLQDDSGYADPHDDVSGVTTVNAGPAFCLLI